MRIRLAAILANHPSLATLEFSDMELPGSFLRLLAGSDPVQRLILRRFGVLRERRQGGRIEEIRRAFSLLPRMQSLRSLELHLEERNWMAGVLKHLSSLPLLESLSVSVSSTNHMEHIASVSSLTHLDLRVKNFEGEVQEQVYRMRGDVAGALPQLRMLTGLQRLELSEVEDAAIHDSLQSLGPHIPSLSSLVLNYGCRSFSLQCLGAFQNLTSIDIMGGFPDSERHHLAVLERLQRLNAKEVRR